jgi:hypothetical protein
MHFPLLDSADASGEPEIVAVLGVDRTGPLMLDAGEEPDLVLCVEDPEFVGPHG